MIAKSLSPILTGRKCWLNLLAGSRVSLGRLGKLSSKQWDCGLVSLMQGYMQGHICDSRYTRHEPHHLMKFRGHRD